MIWNGSNNKSDLEIEQSFVTLYNGRFPKKIETIVSSWEIFIQIDWENFHMKHSLEPFRFLFRNWKWNFGSFSVVFAQ